VSIAVISLGSFLSFHRIMLATWRLVYAFVSKEEQAKEEKTRQQNWEISEFLIWGMSVFMATFVAPFN